MNPFEIIVVVIVVVVLLGLYVHRKKQYYEKRGIPYVGVSISRILRFITGTLDLIRMEEEIYLAAIQCRSPVVAVSYIIGQPILIVSDVELIRNIYIKDFDHFVDRRPLKTQHTNKWFRDMMYNMEGEKWKGTRAKLSRNFTTRRIRRMFQVFKSSCEQIDTYLKEQINYPTTTSGELEFTQTFSKYTMNVIANTMWSLDIPPNDETTITMGDKIIFQFSPLKLFKYLMIFELPKVADLLRLESLDMEAGLYFTMVTQQAMKRRRETGERKYAMKVNDNANAVKSGTDQRIGIRKEPLTHPVTFDDDDVVNNAIMYLLAGFDSARSSLLYVMYCLALNPNVQEKLYEEITSILDLNGGEMSHDVVNEMDYLDMVVNDQRLYPPAPRIERVCTKDYTVPGINILIEKGALIALPIVGIHHDPKYFPDPEKFLPERFNQENKARRSPYAFMPFGHGPRSCLARRFALVEVKALVIQIVRSYRITPCSKTPIPMKFANHPNIKPRDGMWLKISVRGPVLR